VQQASEALKASVVDVKPAGKFGFTIQLVHHPRNLLQLTCISVSKANTPLGYVSPAYTAMEAEENRLYQQVVKNLPRASSVCRRDGELLVKLPTASDTDDLIVYPLAVHMTGQGNVPVSPETVDRYLSLAQTYMPRRPAAPALRRAAAPAAFGLQIESFVCHVINYSRVFTAASQQNTELGIVCKPV
jgi:hypothetical protein